MFLAVDAKIADSFSNDANTKFCPVDEIPDGWEGLDIGPETEKIFADVIKNSKTILWNGPTGVFEFENFTHGSRAVGEAIVEATKNGAFSLVGGGDSVACVNKFGLASGVSYVSTGGGALLEAIEGKIPSGYRCYQRIKTSKITPKGSSLKKRVAFFTTIHPYNETNSTILHPFISHMHPESTRCLSE